MPYSWPQLVVAMLALFLWAAEFLIFPSPGGGRDGLRSFWLVSVSIVASIASSIALRHVHVGMPSPPWLDLLADLGAAAMAAGIVIRYWAIVVLKTRFTRQIVIGEGMVLASTGPYRVLRHPLYVGLTLLTVGSCLFIGNVIGTLLAAVCVPGALVVRIRKEERVLESVLGDTYRKWRRQRF